MATDEEIEAAKDELQAAITRWHEVSEPYVYVDGWVLLTHKYSTELERMNMSMVGRLDKTGQPFALTRGILEVALDGVRMQHHHVSE